MIAELCVQTEGPKVESAWDIAEMAFKETGRHIADSEYGRLWHPIRRLMNKAQAIRKKHLELRSTNTGILSDAEDNLQAGSSLDGQLVDSNVLQMGAGQVMPSSSVGFIQFPQPNVGHIQEAAIN